MPPRSVCCSRPPSAAAPAAPQPAARRSPRRRRPLPRQAELKHGRVCMLAVTGWIATDLGVRFPGDQFQTVSTVDAHDQMVQLGLMQPMLATAFFMEVYSYRSSWGA